MDALQKKPTFRHINSEWCDECSEYKIIAIEKYEPKMAASTASRGLRTQGKDRHVTGPSASVWTGPMALS
jgi:hypothetical protein